MIVLGNFTLISPDNIQFEALLKMATTGFVQRASLSTLKKIDNLPWRIKEAVLLDYFMVHTLINQL